MSDPDGLTAVERARPAGIPRDAQGASGEARLRTAIPAPSTDTVRTRRPDEASIGSDPSAGPPVAGRMAVLDIMRGMAALSVVLFHWRHFFWVAPGDSALVETQQPMFGALSMLYRHGWRAVDFFFCVSGFVFFWLYAERIAAGGMSASRFAVLRLSRLYPLHLVTLAAAAVAQMTLFNVYGHHFAFDINDLYHFALQVTLTSGWGLERAGSFNTPAWSVSVELLLYAAFYVLCVSGAHQPHHLALLVAAAFVGVMPSQNIARGVLSFFLGGLVYRAAVRLRGAAPYVWPVCAVVTAILWLVIPIELDQQVIYRHLAGRLMLDGRDVAGAAALIVSPALPELLLFPMTVLTAALIQMTYPAAGGRWIFLGDMSYSAYLIHYPLQMVFYGTVMWIGWSRDVFYSGWTLTLFLTVLVPLSLTSHRYFERPVQTWIRFRWAALRPADR